MSAFNYKINNQSVFNSNENDTQIMGNIMGDSNGGGLVNIKGGLNITTGHVYIGAGDLHLDGDLIHDQGEVIFSG